MTWILLVLAYGIIKGFREVLKKKALEKNTVIEVLFLYTLISFIIVTPEIRNLHSIPVGTLLFIAVKSLAIFLAWIFSFYAIEHMPVSFYGVLDLSRVIFSTLFGLFILSEAMGIAQWTGLFLVVLGLLLLKVPFKKNGTRSTEKIEPKYVIMALASCILNALSGLFDKILMSDSMVTDGMLQFWYMLFLVLYYGLYIIVRRPGIRWVSTLKNQWVWLLAILFVIADRCLFIANADPASKVTIMTLIKQSSCIVTIICGKLIFKEKDIIRRLVCAAIVISGILISVAL